MRFRDATFEVTVKLKHDEPVAADTGGAGYVIAHPASQLAERLGWVHFAYDNPGPLMQRVADTGARLIRLPWDVTTDDTKARATAIEAHTRGIRLCLLLNRATAITYLAGLGWEPWMGSVVAVENYNEPESFRHNSTAVEYLPGDATHHGPGSLPAPADTQIVAGDFYAFADGDYGPWCYRARQSHTATRYNVSWDPGNQPDTNPRFHSPLWEPSWYHECREHAKAIRRWLATWPAGHPKPVLLGPAWVDPNTPISQFPYDDDTSFAVDLIRAGTEEANFHVYGDGGPLDVDGRTCRTVHDAARPGMWITEWSPALPGYAHGRDDVDAGRVLVRAAVAWAAAKDVRAACYYHFTDPQFGPVTDSGEPKSSYLQIAALCRLFTGGPSTPTVFPLSISDSRVVGQVFAKTDSHLVAFHSQDAATPVTLRFGRAATVDLVDIGGDGSITRTAQPPGVSWRGTAEPHVRFLELT